MKAMAMSGNLMAWAYAWAILVVLVLMQWKKKLPSTSSMHEFFAAMNSKGANIMVLLGMTLFFFVTGIKFIYWTVEKLAEKTITPDNAIIGQGFNWISGAAFGMTLSSMLKAMTGESGKARATDILKSPDAIVTTVTNTLAPSGGMPFGGPVEPTVTNSLVSSGGGMV